MDFTIIVPTYNCEKYLEQALESIAIQEHNGKTQVIVVDNCSCDKTREIAQKYHTEIICETDTGEPDAINKGMKRAKGDVVTWLDSDDIFEPLAFKRVEVIFESHPQRLWLYGKSYFIDAEGKKIRRLITRAKESLQRNYSYDKLCKLCFIPQPSVFMRRSLQMIVGELNIDYRLIFDYEYWLRAGQFNDPLFVDSYLSSMRAHDGSLSVQYSFKQMRQSLELATRFKPNSRLTYLTRFSVLLSTIVYYRTLGRYL